MRNLPHVRATDLYKLRPIVAGMGMIVLVGCDTLENFEMPNFLGSETKSEIVAPTEGQPTEFIEQDVEAPDVFSAKDEALWDGRPSLGGVWVAHPDVSAPERVIIRNQSNGNFVIGALFRRERDIPGPKLQMSSDAAKALDVLAGSPVDLEVVALRKERIPVVQSVPEAAEQLTGAESSPEEIQQSTLDPIAVAGAAIDAADPTPVVPVKVSNQSQIAQSSLPVTRLDKAYVQVGIFNQDENAQRVANQMRNAGMSPTVLSQDSNGKAFWRVVVGPATTAAERKRLQDQVIAEGFSDAYPVSN